ncbi:MAG: helix-turn-helix transcriptional regulator [Kiritimatiellae bacterium]|nr:helix-turn-helix transcriptional regulator [Kiritimatiellia bacterium]
MKRYEKWKDIVELTGPEGFQNELASLTGMPQSTISGIENDRIPIGVERAKVLARALKCHPAVLVFPGWDIKEQAVA